MDTLKEFKYRMAHVNLDFAERELIDLYAAICPERYESLDEIRAANKQGLIDVKIYSAKDIKDLYGNLDGMHPVAILELVYEMSTSLQSLRFHYLHKDDRYAATLGYQ